MKYLKNGYYWVLLAIVGLNLYYRISSINLFKWIYDYDEGAYSIGGLLISQGQVPYRDFTLVHPPLYDLLLAGLYKIFGYNFFYGRILSIIISVGCIVLAYLIVSKLFNRMAGLIAAALFAVFPGLFASWYRVVQEPFGILLILLGLYFALDFLKDKKVGYKLLIAGLFLGLAVTVKYTFIPAVLGFLLASLVITRGRSQGYLIAGIVIGFLAVSSYFLITNLTGFIDQTVQSQFSYRGGGNNTFVDRIIWFPTASFPDKITTVCIFIPYLAFLLSFFKRNWFLTIALGVTIPFSFVYNPLEIKYIVPSLIFTILVIASFVPEAKLKSQLNLSSAKVLAASLVIVLCIAGSSIMRQDYTYYDKKGTTYEKVIYDKTIEYLDGKCYYALDPIIPALKGKTYGEFDTFGLLFTMNQPADRVFNTILKENPDYIVTDAFSSLFSIIGSKQMQMFYSEMNDDATFLTQIGTGELPVLEVGIYKLKSS